MNSLSMESILLALSGVILVAGVLYWFWSHIQLTQKKVQLLENAVFELRGMLQRTESPGPEAGPGPLPPSPPSSSHSESEHHAPIYNDLSDDDWKEEGISGGTSEGTSEGMQEGTPVALVSTPLEPAPQVPEDLQPGGRIETVEEAPAEQPSQFRDLFMSPPVVQPTEATPLDAMPVKDLRRLAEHRGISNVAELRKKELISAIKAQIASGPAPASASAAMKQVEVVKTLDLTELTEIPE